MSMSMSPYEIERWKAWDAFVESTPGAGFMQTSWWADFRTNAGYEHFAAILKSQNEIVGGAVVMKYSYSDNKCFYYIPDGPVVPRDESIAAEVFDAILENLEERRTREEKTVSHLRIEPRWQHVPNFASAFRPIPDLMDRFTEPRNSLFVNLRLSEGTILAQMKPKGRYNIHVAQKHGVSVVEDTSERGIADFYTIYEDMADRQGIKPKPWDYFEDLVSLLSSLSRGSIYFAEHRGERLAAAVVVYFGRRATYFFGGSTATDRHVMAPYLLHFEIMRRAKALRYEWYDLWGVAPQDQPNHPWQNISVFKRKFGGVDVHLTPTLDFVYDSAAYDDYIINEGHAAIVRKSATHVIEPLASVT